MKKKVSYFKHFGAEAEEVPLSLMLGAIKEGAFEEQINELREIKNDMQKYGELKKKLPQFTPSGVFDKKRRAEYLSTYTQVIVLDIDNLGDNAKIIRDKAAEIDYTLSAFLSPGGEGVKILVDTDSIPENHVTAFNQVGEYYEKELNVSVDPSGKDVSRACFVSWDPEMYINENPVAFKTKTMTEIQAFQGSSMTVDNDFQYIADFTEKICSFFPGNRNNYIYLLANNMNRAGIDQEKAELFISSRFSDPDLSDEIHKTIKSAYSHTGEYNKFPMDYFKTASFASFATTANMNRANNTPVIPTEVYDNLPEILKKGTDAFDLDREKDVFLTGAITVLSGCFPNVKGIYDGYEVYSNMNCFVLAPPASGKGRLNYSREMAGKIHRKIISAFEINSTFTDEDKLQKLPRMLFIPADSSAAAVKRSLNLNNGLGIICETEADTLSTTIKQDWGGYVFVILKAFQHEPITYGRAGDDDTVNLGEINCPKLSVCLSGVPNQVVNLIKGTGDGLFSRFIFYNYCYNGKPRFKNVFESTGINNLTEYFNGMAEEVLNLFDIVKEKGDITFSLTKHQQTFFQSHFDKKVNDVYELFGEESLGSVYRLGLIAFRIAMLFSLFRTLEKGELTESIESDDKDIETSLRLSDVYLDHALSVFKSLPGTTKINTTAKIFCELLPKEFKYREAVKIGDTFMGICERSVFNYLQELIKSGWLKQPKKNGTYFNSRLQ